MILKLTRIYENSSETYPVLVNSDNVETFQPIDKGEENYEFGVRTYIEFVNSSIQVVETIFYIADKLKAE